MGAVNAPFFVAGSGVAESYSVALDLQVGQLFQRLDQLERRLSGINQSVAGVQSRFDAFSAAARPIQAVSDQGERVQRVFDRWAASTRNTEAGLRGLIGRLEQARTNVDRNSQAYAVATQNLDRYRASLRGAGDDTDRFAGRVGGLQAVMGAVGAAAIVNSFKSAGVEAAGAERKLGFLTKGFGEYEAAQQSVVRVQKELGISNTEAKQGISNLYAALRPTGVVLNDIEKAFLGYAKAARQTGQSNAEISGGMLQLKQALGSGTLQGDELRSIRENAPAVAQAVARAMDTTVGGLKELGSQGKITSAIVLEALGELASGTIPPITAVDRLSAAWTDFQAEVAGSIGPLTSGLIGFLASILEGFQKLPGPIKDLITAVGALALAVVGLAGAFATYSFASTAIVGGLTAMGVATTAQTGLFGALALAAQAAWASIAWPIVGIVVGLALLTKAAYDLHEPFAWWIDNLGPAMGVMWNDLSYVAKSFGNDLVTLGSDIESAWSTATDWFQPMSDGFSESINHIKNEWNSLPEWLKWVLFPIQGAVKINQASTGYLDSVKKRVEAAKAVGEVEKKVEEQKAKAQQTSEKELKKLADARAKMEKGLSDARLDAEGKIAELRISTAEKAQAWELDIAKERLATERRIADLQSSLALGRDLSAIDASMAGDGGIGDKVKADQKVMLQAKWEMEQKIIGLNRTENDRQKAFTEKLEAFKLETNKATGRIQQAYAEKSGQLVEGYSTASAKILMAGGQNAGAALEASATRSADKLTNALAAASSGVTDSTPFSGSAAKRLQGSISGRLDASGQNGGDMPVGPNNAIKSYHNGLVKAIGTAGNNGNYVVVEFIDDLGNKLEATYSHIAASVRKGDRVVGGQTIGRFDGSGRTFGAHNSVDINSLGNNGSFQRSQETAAARRSADLLIKGYVQGETNIAAFNKGMAQQGANPMGPNGIFKVNGPNTPSSIFQRNADPIAALANSGQGAMQGPSTKPNRPIGQKAVENGKPVVWNGQDYVPDTTAAVAAPVGGAAATAAAAPAGAPANNIVPLPAGFNPASVGTVDPNKYLGGVQQAQNGLNALAGKEKELQTEQAIADYLKQQRDIRAAMTGDLNVQLLNSQLSLATDQQRLELLQSGTNPAYVDQFVQIDQIAQLENARLTAEKLRIEELLKEAGLAPKLRAGLEADLQSTVDRLAAEGGITQEIKDQIAARQALKSSPGAQITEKVAQMKTELADTGGMIISLADTIEGELGSAMSNAISGVITGTTTVQEAFGTMFSNIGKAFLDMATQMIAKALIMKVLGILGGAMGGSSGGGLGFGGNSDPLGAGGGFWGGPSFAGGGFTGDAPRSGGVDGQGGFPAILHPQETVIDHTRLRSGMGGGGGESGGASPITLNVTATKIGDSEFVKVGDLQAAMRQTRKEAAADGEKRALSKLQNSPRTRAQLLR